MATRSHTSLRLSFDAERRFNGFLPLSLLLNMQIQRRMSLLAGSLQELGQRRRHSALKRSGASSETPSEGLALLEERTTVNCRRVLILINIYTPQTWRRFL